MNRRLSRIVHETAHAVREWAEKIQPLHPLAYDQDLAGLCGIATRAVWELLASHGHRSTIAVSRRRLFGEAEEHAWSIVPCWPYPLLVDVTATQFGYEIPRVVVLPMGSMAAQRRWWKPHVTFSTPADFVRYQVTHEWSEGEIWLPGLGRRVELLGGITDTEGQPFTLIRRRDRRGRATLCVQQGDTLYEISTALRVRDSWWLTLSCGHHLSRPKPRATFSNLVSLVMGSRGLAFAPKRVRCLTCKVVDDGKP